MAKIILIFLLVTAPIAAFAAGGCPRTADRLEDFAGCLSGTRGGAGYSAHLDADHQALLNAMAANSGVPPQVMPPSTPIIGVPFMPMYYPYPIYPVIRPNIWLYTGYGMNPYVTIRYSVPLY